MLTLNSVNLSVISASKRPYFSKSVSMLILWCTVILILCRSPPFLPRFPFPPFFIRSLLGSLPLPLFWVGKWVAGRIGDSENEGCSWELCHPLPSPLIGSLPLPLFPTLFWAGKWGELWVGGRVALSENGGSSRDLCHPLPPPLLGSLPLPLFPALAFVWPHIRCPCSLPLLLFCPFLFPFTTANLFELS